MLKEDVVEDRRSRIEIRPPKNQTEIVTRLVKVVTDDDVVGVAAVIKMGKHREKMVRLKLKMQTVSSEEKETELNIGQLCGQFH